ncbi:MAG: alpha/beta fold hydrolase [Pseudohongiellaceae bacterium]
MALRLNHWHARYTLPLPGPVTEEPGITDADPFMTDRIFLRLTLPAYLCMALLSACGPGDESRLQPSGHAVTALAADQPFAQYQSDARQQIRSALEQGPFAREDAPFGPGYALEQVVTMRSPWQIGPDPDCEPATSTTGFLFIHGLSDSPYTVRAVAHSLSATRPCALFRSVLLPGHGTAPGDLLSTHRDEWRTTVTHAVEQLLDETERLHLVGYSTGAALALEQMDRRRDDPRLSSLILLSPALDLGNPLGWLTPMLRYVQPWLSVAPDRDAAKYESFPMNAAAQAHLLLRELDLMHMEKLQRPVFMVTTGDDTTVNPQTAGQFFCERVTPEHRYMLWYHSPETGSEPDSQCEGLQPRTARASALRVVTLSHVGTSLPPTDGHYGLAGGYRQCLRYRNDGERHRQCLEDDRKTVYGEPERLTDSDDLYHGSLVRRTTFNPHYNAMIQSLDCFLQEACQP